MKLQITITTEHDVTPYEIRIGDWIAWEEWSGATQAEFADRVRLADMAYLAWSAARRTNPSTPDDPQAFANTILDWDFQVDGDADPTPPGV